MDKEIFSPWLHRWRLIPDGPPFITHTSQLLPVKTLSGDLEAMLKVTADEDEQTGGALMAWWQGHGAAPVLAHQREAILLRRASGLASLSTMSRQGQDGEACRILCQTANQLHRAQPRVLPRLTPLPIWFSPLAPAARQHGGILVRCAEIAAELLSTPRDVVPLHGDLHHDNVLDFGDSGWLAIDPKGLLGERGFDFANIFTNPDLGNPLPCVATIPAVFQQRLDIVAATAGLERARLLQWIIAWCGLSATWTLESHETPDVAFAVAKQAIAELDRPRER